MNAIVVGNIYPSRGQNGDVHSVLGLSPSIISGQGDVGNGIGSCNAPKIILYDDFNGCIRGGQIIGTVVQNFGREAWRNGWKIIEIYETENIPDRENLQQRGQRMGLP